MHSFSLYTIAQGCFCLALCHAKQASKGGAGSQEEEEESEGLQALLKGGGAKRDMPCVCIEQEAPGSVCNVQLTRIMALPMQPRRFVCL